MSKFAIDSGHGNVNGSLGGDGGAVGYLVEQDCALDISSKVISKLETLGHIAYNVRPYSAYSVINSLQKRCDAARNADYLISIHLNAGGGKGSEVFAMSKVGYALAQKVQDELVRLGFKNRGVKDGSNLYVIRHSKPVAILVEVCFVDSQLDADLYNKLGAEAIANAIVKGLTGQTVISNSGSSEFIKAVQHDLQRVSCLAAGESNATGALDSNTKAAIKQFRYIVGLPDSENIENSLVSALNSITKKPTIGEGWNSPVVAVKFIQWYLGLTKTGIVDPKMTQAIKDWQVKAGIWSATGADGVIREKDWNKILK